MLNYTPLTQVRIKKKRLKLEGWQIGVLIFFVVITGIGIIVYSIINYRENIRLQEEIRRIGNVSQATEPLSSPTSQVREYATIIDGLKQNIATNNYKISLYGSLPILYPMNSSESSKAAALQIPISATYDDAVELYLIKGTVLKRVHKKSDVLQTIIFNTASQSANFVDFDQKTYLPIKNQGAENQWHEVIVKMVQFQSPLWLLEQAESAYTKENATWVAPYKGKKIVVHVSEQTGLPTKIDLVEESRILGSITTDFLQIDDSTAFATIPARYTEISLKEATASAQKKKLR